MQENLGVATNSWEKLLSSRSAVEQLEENSICYAPAIHQATTSRSFNRASPRTGSTILR